MKVSGGANRADDPEDVGGMGPTATSGAAGWTLNFMKTGCAGMGIVLGRRVNAVAPGPIASSGADHYDADVLRSAILPQVMKGLPLKRLGEEAEVSSAIVYLLSRGAAFITGVCIRIDGRVTCPDAS